MIIESTTANYHWYNSNMTSQKHFLWSKYYANKSWPIKFPHGRSVSQRSYFWQKHSFVTQVNFLSIKWMIWNTILRLVKPDLLRRWSHCVAEALPGLQVNWNPHPGSKKYMLNYWNTHIYKYIYDKFLPIYKFTFAEYRGFMLLFSDTR